MGILIVDNSFTMRKIIRKHLENNGYFEIDDAEHGEDALEKLQNIDLVLTDWIMPKMNGITLIREIRNSPVYSEIGIIMVTVEGAQAQVLEAFKAGVTDYIVKPFKGPDLIKKIKKHYNG